MEEKREEINLKRLYQYLNLRYVPSEETIVEGVKLDITPPRVDASKINIEQTHNVATKIPQLFSASIEECLAKITPGKEIGVFISGGLDSTIMLHFLAQHEDLKLNTFTMGFGEPTDELYDAQEVAEFYDTKHHELIVDNIMKDFAKQVKLIGFPKRNLWGYYLAEYASKYVDVVFDGLGGDELFGGYTFRYEHALDMPNRLFSDRVRAYVQSTHLRDFIPKCKIFGDQFKRFNANDVYEPFKNSFHNPLSFLDQFFIADLNVKCAYDFIPLFALDKEAGLTAHTPWFSQDLIDLAFSLPYRWKVHDGVGKQILRETMGSLVPRVALEKKKQGFGMNPLTVWESGLRNAVKVELLNGLCIRDGYINPKYVVDVLSKQTTEEMIPHYNKVWDALAFEIWYRDWLKE